MFQGTVNCVCGVLHTALEGPSEKSSVDVFWPSCSSCAISVLEILLNLFTVLLILDSLTTIG